MLNELVIIEDWLIHWSGSILVVGSLLVSFYRIARHDPVTISDICIFCVQLAISLIWTAWNFHLYDVHI